MRRWGAIVSIVVAGCTTGITAPMDMATPPPADLSATSDLGTGCTLAFSGDVNVTVACRIFLCHPTDGMVEDLDLAGPIDDPRGPHAIFDVDGAFALRSYTRADLRSIDVGIMVGGKSYVARDANGTAAVTISGVQPPSGSDVCSGVAHGTATATLVELVTEDGGTQSAGPGRVTVNATF